jgi:hypothetical protein
MFGGVKYTNDKYAQFSTKETSNELWSLNLLTNKWTLISNEVSSGSSASRQTPPSSSRSTTFKHYVLPIGVSGHTMHLLRNVQDNTTLISVFFGYSEYYGANLNLVQEYNIEARTWTYRNVYSVNIGYGHTSTFNPINNMIYFYGGLLLTSSMPSSYDPIKTLLFDTVSDNLFSGGNTPLSKTPGLQPPHASVPLASSSGSSTG